MTIPDSILIPSANLEQNLEYHRWCLLNMCKPTRLRGRVNITDELGPHFLTRQVTQSAILPNPVLLQAFKMEHCRATKDFCSDGSIVVTYIPRQKEGETGKLPKLPLHWLCSAATWLFSPGWQVAQTFCYSAGGVGLMLWTSVMLAGVAEGEPTSFTRVQLITPRVPTVPVPEGPWEWLQPTFSFTEFPFCDAWHI